MRLPRAWSPDGSKSGLKPEAFPHRAQGPKSSRNFASCIEITVGIFAELKLYQMQEASQLIWIIAGIPDSSQERLMPYYGTRKGLCSVAVSHQTGAY